MSGPATPASSPPPDAVDRADRRPRRLPAWRAEARCALELAALVAFAVAQPVLAAFGRAPDFFVFERADRGDILAFAAAFSFVPWLAATALGLAGGVLAPRRRGAIHLVLVGLLTAAVSTHLVKRLTPLPTALVVACAALLSPAVVLLYRRTRWVGEYLRLASPALPVFVALFLFASPVSDLLFPQRVEVYDLSAFEEGPPVVLLVFDEFPTVSFMRTDGTIDADLFPNLARLAGRSTWYRQATAIGPATWHAVPSILSGRYPREGTLPLADDHPDNVFTLLGGQYSMQVSEAITRLCPLEVCPPVGEHGGFRSLARTGLDVLGDIVSPAETTADPNQTLLEDADGDGRPDAAGIELDAFSKNQPDRVTRFLDGFGTTSEPALHYLHVLLPHTPWSYLPSGRVYPYPPRNPGQLEANWSRDPWPAALNRQRHLLQAQYADRLVGEMLDRLEARNLLDSALVMVLADHGVAFTPGQPVKGNREAELHPEILPEVMWVPFFVKLPGQSRGVVSDGNVETIDVLPTVADVVGVDLPFDVDGRSLLGPPRPNSTKVWYQMVDSTVFGVKAGERHEIDADEWWPRVLARGVDAFAPPSDGWRLYRIGPAPDLPGRRVDDLDTGASLPIEIHVDDAGRYEDVDPASGTVPALLTAAVQGNLPEDAAIALAVDGTIAAVAPVFPDQDRPAALALMIPEALLTPGGHELAWYLLDDEAGSPLLRPLTGPR